MSKKDKELKKLRHVRLPNELIAIKNADKSAHEKWTPNRT